MKQCDNHAIRKSLIPSYQADMLGIAGVRLLNAVIQERCVECDYLQSITIPNLQGLIAAVAVTRAFVPQKLRGGDIRFLREALGMTGLELAAKVVKVSPSQLSRWENDKEPMGQPNERLLRLYIADELIKRTALKVDKSILYRMDIEAPLSVGAEVPMEFYLQSPEVKVTRKREPRWRSVKAAA
jgi:transcriptional regulator with XRE-family HTH domain